MTYAIAGVSGNTGKIVAETLLARGEKVRVVVRDAAKGESWRARGAEVAVADLVDGAALTRALRDVKGVYALIPPNYAATDFRAYQRDVARALAAAIRENTVPHVVLLSSVGAQHQNGTGPIAGLHDAEETLGALPGTALTSVRAGYFFDNFVSSLGAARSDGILPSFFPADLPVPMVSTGDIGRLAAKALQDGPNGAQVLELGTLRTMNQIAGVLGELLGKAVTVHAAPRAAIHGALLGAGLPEAFAALYTEMAEAILDGHVAFEGRGKAVPSDEPLTQVFGPWLTA